MAKKKVNLKARSNNRRRKKQSVLQNIKRLYSTIAGKSWGTIFGFITIFFSVLLFFSVISYIQFGENDQSVLAGISNNTTVENPLGKFGAYLSNKLVDNTYGNITILYSVFFMLLGIGMIRKNNWFNFWNMSKWLFYTILSSTWIALFLSTIQKSFEFHAFGNGWGGLIGSTLYDILIRETSTLFLYIILFSLLIIFLLFVSPSFVNFIQSKSLPKIDLSIFKRTKNNNIDNDDDIEHNPIDVEDDTTKTVIYSSDIDAKNENKWENNTENIDIPITNINNDSTTPISIEKAPEAESSGLSDFNKDDTDNLKMRLYKKPPLDILKAYNVVIPDGEEVEKNKKIIVDTLAQFRISVKANKAIIGPTVTLYEIVPDPGVKVESVSNSQANLSMALKSEGVRIVPIPEQGIVGIEVPNSTPQIVSMRSVLGSKKFASATENMILPVGIGKSITNKPFIFDLAKTPHLLVAGATGQGKSVGLNAIITSLLYSKTPDELKFVLIDPKMLEFSAYQGIKNQFLAVIPGIDEPIITDMKYVVPTLNSLTIEMDARYQLMAAAKVKNLKEYNEAIADGRLSRLEHSPLPYIVIVIDEFADLIMTSGKEVEMPIARIAQKARAAGIHMIIATQRPSTKVITGLIKSNFPARLSFKVVQANDSRIILDSNGAENLIGRGDMLFSQGSDLHRLQCAFMDNDETDALVQFISMQESDGHPMLLPEVDLGVDGEEKVFDRSQKDPLFEDVARYMVESGNASTSNIQRKFNVGFNRAGRIMDQIEGAGIVGPQFGSKPRDLKVKDLMQLEELLSRL